MKGRLRVVAGVVAVTALAACSGSGDGQPPAPVGTLSATVASRPSGAGTAPPVDADDELAARLAGVVGAGLTPARHGAFGMDQAEIRTAEAGDRPVVDGRPAFDRYLRVRYPAGSASQTVMRETGAPSGGAQAYLYYDGRPADTLVLRYYVRFPDGFDFVKGGKLPGLFGGTVTSGQHIPDGSNGFSTRLMWRTDGEGEVYAYLPSSVQHGTSIGRGQWVFPTGKWTEVRQEVRLNSPDREDGEVAVWVDGRMVLDSAGIRFRTSEELGIEGVFFSTFFGGDDPSWASPIDQYADFAAISVQPSSKE